jgi:hypothetical protein
METTSPPHPIRLVVTDDLRRSRLTVFFRLLLAIPHFLWLAILGIAVFFAAFFGWWVTLFTGRLPQGLHGFLAGYVRYLTHVQGYVYLAANPFPGFYAGGAGQRYPIDVEIDPPAPQRRLVTFFRLLFALPALFIAGALSTAHAGFGAGSSAGVAAIALFLIWFAALARAQAPRGLRDLAAWAVGYEAQVAGYLLLLTDRYPTSDPRVHVPAAAEPLPAQPGQVVITDDLRRSRLTVFFRLPLAIPHIVWIILWTAVAWVVALLNWFAALALGHTPRPFARFLSAYIRYGLHVSAFLFLTGNPFPGFVGKPGSYPIDFEFADPFQKQRRLTIFFRLFLAIPALFVSSAGQGLAEVAAFLGWFASLIRGRMPEGLRNASVWGLGYSAQASAYLFLLSERYPYSSPSAISWPARGD